MWATGANGDPLQYYKVKQYLFHVLSCFRVTVLADSCTIMWE